MDSKTVAKILEETAYVRTGGSSEELRCAQYLADRCRELGAQATLMPFQVPMAQIKTAVLYCTGR